MRRLEQDVFVEEIEDDELLAETTIRQAEKLLARILFEAFLRHIGAKQAPQVEEEARDAA